MLTWKSELELPDANSSLNYGKAVYLLDLFVQEGDENWMVTRLQNRADAKNVGNLVRILAERNKIDCIVRVRGDLIWMKKN